MAIGSAVRLMAMLLKISEEDRPKRIPASSDRGWRKLCSQHAKALILNLQDLFLNGRLAVSHGQTSLPERGSVFQSDRSLRARLGCYDVHAAADIQGWGCIGVR